jgi:hypothetical protein
MSLYSEHLWEVFLKQGHFCHEEEDLKYLSFLKIKTKSKQQTITTITKTQTNKIKKTKGRPGRPGE